MFEWDEDKNKATATARGLNFADAWRVFEDPQSVTFRDRRADYGEERFITMGLLERRLVVIAHTPRGENTRIISMRKANDREQKAHQEQLEKSRRHDRQRD